MDETLSGGGADEQPSHSFAEDIEPYVVAPIGNLPTYEGTASILHISSDGSHESIPVRARVIVGPDTSMPYPEPDGSYAQAADVFSALFNAAVLQLADGSIGYNDTAASNQSARLVYQTIVDAARRNSELPITVIFAHGFNLGDFHFLLREGKESDFTDIEQIITAMRDGRLIDFQALLSMIKERDGLAPRDTDLTVVLASCNQSGARVEHGATIVSRSGIVARGPRSTGVVQVYEPATNSTKFTL